MLCVGQHGHSSDDCAGGHANFTEYRGREDGQYRQRRQRNACFPDDMVFGKSLIGILLALVGCVAMVLIIGLAGNVNFGQLLIFVSVSSL